MNILKNFNELSELRNLMGAQKAEHGSLCDVSGESSSPEFYDHSDLTGKLATLGSTKLLVWAVALPGPGGLRPWVGADIGRGFVLCLSLSSGISSF